MVTERNSVLSLSARKNQVGIMTASLEPYIWIVGGALRSLPKIKLNTDFPEEKIVASDIFFHFRNQDTIFLVIQSRARSNSGTNFATKMTVQRFMNGTMVDAQNVLHYTMTEPQKHRSTMISNDSVIGIEVWEHPYKVKDESLYRYITYDMNKNRFGYREVGLHSSFRRNLHMCDNLIWRDQIYHPIFNKDSGQTELLQVITISKSLSDVWNGLSESVGSSSKSSILSSEMFFPTEEQSGVMTAFW